MDEGLIQPKKAMKIAKELGVACSSPTIYRLMQSAGAHKVGGRWYIDETVWKEYISGTAKR